MNRHIPSSEIMIGEFRQILAWPFVMPGDRGKCGPVSNRRWFKKCAKKLKKKGSHWKEKSPRELMAGGDIGAYEEENVFHDYVNDTLFRSNPSIGTFQYESLRKITFEFRRKHEGKSKSYAFEIPFNSLRIYDCGVAMLTLELRYVGPRLALDEAQFLTHSLRRANPPFWFGSDALAYCPLRAAIHEEVLGPAGEKREPENSKAHDKRESEDSGTSRPAWPSSFIAVLRGYVGLIGARRRDNSDGPGTSNEIQCELGDLQNRESALCALGEADYLHPLFSWWLRILAPLSVEGNPESGGAGGPENLDFARFPLFHRLVSSRIWLRGMRKNRANGCARAPNLRQIMDARIPALTTISLKGDRRPSEALHSVSKPDWFRIAEAIEENAASGRPDGVFAKMKLKKYVYDRFMPSAESFDEESSEAGARFTFASQHFAAVLAGGSGEPNFPEMVRRHYRHMQHFCLLEFAAVVGISQRLYRAVNRRNSRKIKRCDGKFRREVLALQETFMDFTHRYRFTGVSNELHMGEMFAYFRRSMKLDGMYKETKEEIDSLSNLAYAQRQMRMTNWTVGLTVIAVMIALIGLPLGFYQAFCMDCEQIWQKAIRAIAANAEKLNWN